MIDWNKPVRTIPSKYAVSVYPIDQTTLRRLVWINNADRRLVVVVDKAGLVVHIATPFFSGMTYAKVEVGDLFIENVPEEPKDHLHLYLDYRGKWDVNAWLNSQLYSRADWERLDKGEKFGNGFLVKVPT